VLSKGKKQLLGNFFWRFFRGPSSGFPAESKPLYRQSNCLQAMQSQKSEEFWTWRREPLAGGLAAGGSRRDWSRSKLSRGCGASIRGIVRREFVTVHGLDVVEAASRRFLRERARCRQAKHAATNAARRRVYGFLTE
jgi:hypothetical protein